MITIPKNYILIKPIEDFNTLQSGEFSTPIGKSPDGEQYNPGEHTLRRGYLTALPTKIEYNERGTPYKNYVRPNLNSIVYYDYLAVKDCDTYKDNLILPYNSLILEVIGKDVKMLNGYLLCQHLPRTSSELDIKSDYEDRFVIKRAGVHNLNYLDGSIDDESIIEGYRVITRFSNYPKLEADYQCRLDGESYIYMQRKDCIGILP